MILGCILRWLRIDLSGPWTSPARGGGPALDRALNARRIGDYFPGGKVPR